MDRWKRRGSALSTLLLAALLVGCTDQNRAATEQPAPTTSRETESDDLAQTSSHVLELYETYLGAVGSLYQERNDDYTQLLEWATPEMASRETAAISELSSQQISVSGWYELQGSLPGASSDGEFRVPVCVDVSGARLIDSRGVDVTPADRPSLVPLLLRFTTGTGETVRLSAQDPWDPEEPSACDS